MNNSDANFKKQVQRLHRLTVYGRWLIVVLCWGSLGNYGLWGLKTEIKLWQAHFTWTAVRYGLAYNLLPSTCLFFCIALTTSVLVWQSRNILYGIPSKEKQQLEKQVQKINLTGPRHLLWRFVVKES